jgi:hypothetical protein
MRDMREAVRLRRFARFREQVLAGLPRPGPDEEE